MSKSLSQWLDFIQRSHPKEIDMGLSRTAHVFQQLSLNLEYTKIVTVAGTNGKGTTCRTIEAITQASGFNVGVYSSPHLIDFNERIRINGDQIHDDKLCEAFELVDHARGNTSLTYFEFVTLAALVCFAKHELDVIVLEVGLGGRLDAVNILDADVASVTSIGYDHQSWLGDTLDQIAFEKCGVVKSKTKAVLAFDAEKQGINLPQLLSDDVWMLGRDYDIHELQRSCSFTIHLDRLIPNIEQSETTILYTWNNEQLPAQNVVTAILSCWRLYQVLSGNKSEPLKQLLSNSNSLKQTISDIRIAGRFQRIFDAPQVIVDVGHNAQAADYLIDKIKRINSHNIHYVVGMLKDKNIEQTLTVMADIPAHWYVCDLEGDRGEKSTRLKNALAKVELKSLQCFSSVDLGLKTALEQASSTDMIYVFGSFLTVAQAIQYMQQQDKLSS
ncbi:bifunctional folylpolyglutamate synthase/dihydrofolate synthase [Glaciecola sp. 1036]|uniref:bifunctional folylpolyglutamate synthase/dihydrofolate synthase n=1 Tax=Alteromonadaceae TaxID=72275 RepID=UPI003D02512A